MTQATVYIWATYLVPAGLNILSAFNDDCDTVYIHAFADESDEDGEGFHITDEGADLSLRPAVAANATSADGFSRVVLMIPARGYELNSGCVFSPAALAGIEAEQWGYGTADDIEQEIEELEKL